MPSEPAIRAALKPAALAAAPVDGGGVGLVEEFTLPPTGARADLAVIGAHLVGYEIKSAADSLRRLPRQVTAFERVFERCWLVCATRHMDAASEHLPDWWGLIEADDDEGEVRLIVRRSSKPSPAVELEIIVRLLWREEVAAAIRKHGENPELQRGRGGMWTQLLRCGTQASIQNAVRDALRARRSWRGTGGLDRLALTSGAAR